MLIARVFLILLCILSLMGCEAIPSIKQFFAGQSESEELPATLFDDQAPSRTGFVDQYRIGVDDLVRIDVWRNPDLSVTVPVRPDGKISMPLAGDVQAGGLTPNQVAEIVRQKLELYIRTPQVSVILTELRSDEFLSRVRVTGAVRAPISLPYRQGMTVLDVVLEAGGSNEFASPNETKLYRRTDGETKVYTVKLEDILLGGNLTTNFALRPGDVLTVPERGIF